LSVVFIVSAPECRDIETALYDRTYVRTSLAYYVQWLRELRALQLSGTRSRELMVAYEYTCQDHEYMIIRTMNTKYERCGMAFLFQAAHKIAVSCPKTFIVSCSGKWNRPWTLHGGPTR